MHLRSTWLAVTFGGAISLAGCAGVPLPREQLSDPGGLLYNGYANPKVDCYRCHNGDGRGAWGPSLLTKVPKLSEEKIVQVIQKPKGFMPKYGGKMSDEEMFEVARWLKATMRPAPPVTR